MVPWAPIALDVSSEVTLDLGIQCKDAGSEVVIFSEAETFILLDILDSKDVHLPICEEGIFVIGQCSDKLCI